MIRTDNPKNDVWQQIEHPVALPRPVFLRQFNIPAGHGALWHSHTWGQLLFADKGILQIELRDTRYSLPPQYALWLPSTTEHQVFSKEGASFRSLYIQHQDLETLRTAVEMIQVGELLRSLILKFASQTANYQTDSATARLVSVIIDELQQATPAPLVLPQAKDPRLQLLADKIAAQAHKNWTLSESASLIHLTEKTLSRYCHRDLGLSFREWLQRIRIMTALSLLDQQCSITNAALSVGYRSPSAFSQAFKRVISISPSNYLKTTASE